MKARHSLLVIAALSGSALGQTIVYSGGTYSQNFDGLASVGAVVIPGRGPHALIWNFIDYIHDNPVNAGLCEYPAEWKWSSAGTYKDGRDGPLQLGRSRLRQRP